MKFKHFRQELIRALPQPEAPKPQVRQPAIPRQPERVEGGVLRLKPVDRIAAKMFWKAGWLERPIAGETTKQQEPKMNPILNHTQVEGVGIMIPGSNAAQLAAEQLEVARERLKSAAAMTDEIDKFSTALDVAVGNWNTKLAEIGPALGVMVGQIRQARLAVVSETATMISSLRDIRAFFLGADHAEEVKRLREFVELCERLKALKADGTLDAVSDTILKLS